MYYKGFYYVIVLATIAIGYFYMEFVNDFGLESFFGSYQFFRTQAIILFGLGNIVYITLVGIHKLLTHLGVFDNKIEKQ